MTTRKIFGLPIFSKSFNEALEESINRKSSYYCFLNAHMLHEYKRNPAFESVLENATLIFPDGMPIVYSMRLFFKTKQERIAGNDFIFEIVKKAKQENLKLYFIGGSGSVLSQISAKLSNESINHQTYSPPFRPIDQFDFTEQAKLINSFNPDIVLVGLGCPKQEIWMFEVSKYVSAPMFGLGGAFALYAGVDSRAPKLLRDLSLEWVYRLILEPRRMFWRYLVTNSFFIFRFIKEAMNRIYK
ncbi:MAG: WecB/TagA/CpsF family glycosyltransferase [Cyclobacteriaceae bacterium]